MDMKPSNILKFFTFCFALFTLFSCGTSENNYDAMGVFEATEVVVSAKAQGELISFDVNEGDEVKTDVVLGVIDATKLTLQQQSLEDSRDAQTARILDLKEQTASIQQQISNLQQEYERFSGLLSKGAATQKQVDDLADQIKVLKAQLVARCQREHSASSRCLQSADEDCGQPGGRCRHQVAHQRLCPEEVCRTWGICHSGQTALQGG